MSGLEQDQYTNIIQAMPFAEGLIGLTSGSYKSVTLIRCTAVGGLTLTFTSEATAVVTMEAGDDRSVLKGTEVEITSGTFDLA